MLLKLKLIRLLSPFILHRPIVGLMPLFIALFMVSCVTGPQKMQKSSDVGVWSGKVLMLKKESKDKKWANVTWASDSVKDRMRVDVYAFMDIPIATFLKVDGHFHLWLFLDKTYYHSDQGEKLFSRLTKINVHPDLFYQILSDGFLPKDQWSCQIKTDSNLCLSKDEKLKVDINLPDVDERQMTIKNISGEMRLRLSRSKVEMNDDYFKPMSSSHFKTIQI